MTKCALAMVLLLGPACAQDPGPLDRETVAEIAKSRGDAQGGARTGTYLATLDIGDCDCPDEIGLVLCLSQEITDAQLELRVVEGDGFMTADLTGSELAGMSGAIDADGTATLGSVYIGYGFSSDLVVIGRFDGGFGDDGTLTGTAQQEAHGEFGGASIACGGAFEVDAFRLY